MLQHAARLLLCDARKPLQKILHRGAIFNVLEQGSDRHASTTKYPRTADSISVAFDGGTGGPIDHL